MELPADVFNEIEELKKQTDCNHDFSCLKSNSGNRSKVKVIVPETAMECLDERADFCTYSFAFGEGYFCKCPIRKYISKELSK
ncbi:MAG: hypothetical protein PHF37_09540 [Phycisphaerae bacterium]|nr:hypothetical protein [Phycisphaerae bacterium]